MSIFAYIWPYSLQNSRLLAIPSYGIGKIERLCMDFNENRSKTLARIYQRYPEAQSADLGALKGDVGFWVILKDGATIFLG